MFAPDSPCPCGSGKLYNRCCLAKEMAAKNNIAAIYVDNINKTVVLHSSDMLFNQLDRDCPDIAKSFDAVAKPQLIDVSRLFGEITSLATPYILGRDIANAELHPTCARLLFDALTTFTACVDLARRGFRRQFASLSRDMIETLAVIPHLLIQPNALADFHSGKLKSTKAISSAKLVIPIYGEIYGNLSNNFVHVGQFHSSLSPFDAYSTDGKDIVFIIQFIKLTIFIAHVIAELAFFRQLPSSRYWKEVQPSQYLYDPSEQAKDWMAGFLGGNASGTDEPFEAHTQTAP